MKRSEMIQYIAGLLKVGIPKTEPTTPEELAEHLLTCLESIGMAPPEIETKFYDRANCEYHRVHEWEEE